MLGALRRAAAVLLLAPVLAWAADPQIASLVDDPDPVTAGGLYTYTLRIDNNATSAATNTRLRLTVPAGAAFVSASPASQNCSATTPTQIDCDLGTLGGNGADVRSIVLTWRATVAGLATINGSAVLSADNDSSASNNTATSTTTVVSGANLSLAMSGSPSPVVAGGNVSYALMVANAGPNDSAGGLVVTTNLSPSSAFVSASGSGWSCSHSAGVVTCSRAGTHAVGAAIPAIGIVATVNAASGTVTASASVAPATGGTAEPDSTDNTASVDTAITPGGDVRIASIAVTSGTPATAGSNVSFRIEPRNAGPSTATGVTVIDTVPVGWSLVSASGPGWSCSTAGRTATCTRGSLPTSAADDITLVATAPGSGAVAAGGNSYTHSATIAVTTPDAVPANNTASVSVLVLRDGADLALAKTTTPDPVALGSPLASSITVSNAGPRAATGPLRVIDLLSGASFLSASGTGWSCSAAGAVVTCNHANPGGLAVGASLPVLTINATATLAGSVSNTACTGGSVPAGAGVASASPPVEGDPNPGNDCSTASALSTSVRPDLAIAKTTSTPSGGDKVVSPSEGSVTYTLVVSNVSGTAEAATGIRITDQVPGFLSGRTTITAPVTATVSAGTATFNCAVSGDTVSCSQTGGTLNPGQTVTVPITVNRPMAEGTFTNTARVANVSEGDPVSPNNTASDTVTIQPIADVEMTGKTVTPSTVRAGENATYVLSYRNNGPSAAAGVVLTDTIAFPPGDAGFTVLSVTSSAAGSTCSIAAGAQLTPAASSFTCTIGSLIDGQSESVTLLVRPNWQPGNGARTVPNSVAITTTTAESPSGGDNGNNSQNTTLTVAPAEVDLLVNTTDITDPVPFAAGNTFLDYRVRVTNNGPSYGTGVRFSELMTPPAGRRVRFVCDTSTAGGSSCNAVPLCAVSNVTSGVGTALPAFNCSVPAGNATTGTALGDLAVGQSKDVFLRFEVLDTPPAAGDVYTSQATASANEPDGFQANNTENETTTTRQQVDIRVTKTASAPSVSVFQPFTWTIQVENRGLGTVHATNLSDTLPAGMQLTGAPVVAAPGAGAACTVTGQQLACGLGVLNGGQSATVTLPVRMTSVPTGGSVTNTATVDNDPAVIGAIDIPGSNNTGSATVAVTASSIAGTVFEDRDRSGANGGTPQAAGSEPRIAGVTLTLTGTDAYGNAVSQTTTTDASGNYLFGNLAPAGAVGYTLTETQPAGYANSPSAVPASGAGAPTSGGSYAAGAGSANSVYTGIVLPAATAATQYHFPELRLPGLAGFVYVDVNGNGSRDAGADLPIAGATLRLLNAGTGALVATTLTDATGAYAFTGLDPLVAYTLEEPLPASPAGLANGPVNPGVVNGAACAAGCTAQPNAPAAGTDRIAAIDLSSGADGTQFNFGERQTAPIAGTVFVDTNGDGTQGAGEAPLPGVTITLVQGPSCTTGTVLQTTTTAADGSWRFDGVVAYQDYLVCQAQPAGYGTGSANGTPASNQIPVTALPAGGVSGQTFGERPASLRGTVYADFSAATPGNTDNGAQDAGETGLAGVPVTLTGRDLTGAAVSRSTTTDASGNFRFDNLLQSDATGYTLTEGAIPAAAGTFNDGRETAGTAGGSTAVNDAISGIVLPAGSSATGYLFGELPVATVSGTVYVDRDRSGTMDPAPADGRLPGVIITLVGGTSCSGAVVASTSTDASGNYSFSGVSAGLTYTVCQTQPAGYADGPVNPGTAAASTQANAITITGLPASGSTGNLFGERVASIAGAVYADASPATPANTDNGVKNAGETGIAGVTITLTGRDVTGAPVNRSSTTDASGNYRFDDLLQSDATGYTLTEGAIPASAGSFNDGRDTAGSAGGTAGNDQISAIVLPAGTAATGYNFGELPIAPISGTVYIDRNRNGTPEAAPADGRIAGVTLTLYPGSSCTGTPVASTVTDASGNYTFSGASVGLTYTVCEAQPVGYADGPVNPGTSAASGGANRITITNLPPSGSAGNQFGELVGSIAGVVVLDANHDGVRQGGDAGIPGVVVTLTGTDATGAPVNRSTTTDGTGAFRFDDLLAPNAAGYTLTEQAAQPVVGGVATLNGRTTPGTVAGSPLGTGSGLAASPSTLTGIALPAGADGIGYFFGEILPVGVSGTVFADHNHNGSQNPGEPGLPGVTIVITGTDDTGAAVTRPTTTAADGTFNVPDLRPGTYTITEPTQPAGTSNGLTTAGPAGGTATPIGSTPSAVTGIVLTTPGTTAPGNLFAELPANSAVAGRVWLDADNNGSIGASEAGIAGVTLTLTGTDVAGRAVTATTTTDASGAYRFDGLVPGTYTVTEPSQPPGTLDGVSRPGATGGSASPKGSLPSVIGSIPLGVNQASTGHDFGEVPVALISGRVYADNNDNGAVDPGEAGLPGVTLVLTGTDDLGQPVRSTVTTAADGSWAFENLRPGTYTVTEPTQPAGTVNGRTTAGSAGGTAASPATTPSAISGIVLAPGAQATANNFGEIGNSPNLLVSQTHAPATLTVGHASSWPISVRNGGELPTTGAYTVEGRLPTGLTLAAVPTGNGWACTATVGSAAFSCTSSTVLAPGATHPGPITVSANVGAAAVPLSPVSAWVLVEGGGEVEARRPDAAERSLFAGNPAALPVCLPSIAHNVCREPAPVQLPGAVAGTVWFDVGTTSRLLDAGDQRLAGWLVEVVDKAGGQVVGRATTGTNGAWQVDGLVPGVELLVRFRDPASGVVFGYPVNGDTAPGASGASCAASGLPAAGQASSCVGTGATPALTVVLAPGQLLAQQSLPVDPSGVVYDSGSRQPVTGAVVSLAPAGSCPGWNPAAHVVGGTLGGYTVNGNAIAMTVGSGGFYQFLLAPGAPASCAFGLTVTPPAGYVAPSLAIPPTAGPFAPGGAVGSVVAVQPQAGAPTGTPGTATTYYLALTLGSGTAGVVHNHLPLDPELPLSLALSKTGDKARAEVGDSVRYTITVAMPNGPRPRQTTVVDRLPAGFTYIAGTATVNDRPIADPAGGIGPTLAFHFGQAPADGRLVLRYRVRVGVGAQQGDGINRAQAVSCVQPAGCVDAAFAPLPGGVSSNEGRHRVEVTGGVFTTEACVLGKVFIDCNGNHVQDREELGIPGVRLVLSDGTTLVSDSEGKYSMCGLAARGHVLRIDPLTLPRGSRLTTSSNRNLGDAGSLWLDLKNGELHRADFVEGSCSNTVLEQTKARRAQGEVRAPETEKQGAPALRFDSKAHGLDTQRSPQQGTDGANQQAPKVRAPNAADPSAAPAGAQKPARTNDESNVPTPRLPMNRPPPTGRDTGVAPDASAKGANDGPR